MSSKKFDPADYPNMQALLVAHEEEIDSLRAEIDRLRAKIEELDKRDYIISSNRNSFM